MLGFARLVKAEFMLFDTDVIIWFLRGNAAAAEMLAGVKQREASLITWLELLQGVRNKREMAELEALFPRLGFTILPLSESVGKRAADYLKEHVLKDGLVIADSLIAATAVEHGLSLATANDKHFRKLGNLKLHILNP